MQKQQKCKFVPRFLTRIVEKCDKIFLTSNFFLSLHVHFVEEGTFVGTVVRTDVRLYGKTD